VRLTLPSSAFPHLTGCAKDCIIHGAILAVATLKEARPTR